MGFSVHTLPPVGRRSSPIPPIYELYIADTRYSVPTLTFVVAECDDDARDQASRLLSASPHYSRVEVGVAGATLFTVERERRRAAQTPELQYAND